ncbi:RHS repeat-associated core domain-containing protein [Aneurinibacillus tyrosinisolvens]|uniref:RHS repeat-associated core domain-containing protein n=1 Tax=Aneurinibacillus tyrosinisolvens TaxID=1443435 RepID=UPI00069B8E89|nr:RHS repeat-associated core domain-containing protein [Aneurinibacillus tyrosinisolvens]
MDGTTIAYEYDAVGNSLTDGNGNTVAQYQYDAWGNITSSAGLMKDANSYRYAGYRYDNETGLYYLMARYYDASIGRFITRDTFHGFENDPSSLNQYAYTKNNPVMYIDPTGHWSWKDPIKSAMNWAIHVVADEFRTNTLTDISLMFLGGGVGALRAFKAAQQGLSYIERYVLKKSVIRFFKGAIAGFLGEVTPVINKITSYGNKLFQYETWFDSTRTGKAIDNGITKAGMYLHSLVNKW